LLPPKSSVNVCVCICVAVGLGAGLAVGAVAEAAKRTFGLTDISDDSK